MFLFLNLCRQNMKPCEAEMLILEVSAKTGIPSNFSSSPYGLETGSIFVGGLPYSSAIKQVFFFIIYFKMFDVSTVAYEYNINGEIYKK